MIYRTWVIVKVLHVGHNESLWISAQHFPNLKWKLILIGTKLVFGVNMKAVDNFVSFPMALVWRENDFWFLSYDENTQSKDYIRRIYWLCYQIIYVEFTILLVMILLVMLPDYIRRIYDLNNFFMIKNLG